MKVEGGKMAEKLVNHQFKILGEKMTFEEIPEDGIVRIGKKKVRWYEHYLFTEEQEKEWRDWCKEQVKDCHVEVDMFMIDMVYGFNRRYKKEGELL